MDEVAAIVKAIAAVAVVSKHRISERHDEVIKTLNASLSIALEDWIKSEVKDAQ
jgi:hypothetical protein